MQRRVRGQETPSRLDRVIGATNLFFGVFLFLVHFAIPVTGRPVFGLTLAPGVTPPNLVALFIALLIFVAGFEKWTGRQAWGLALAARFAPRTRGDPLVYTLVVVLFWLFWKVFTYGAALMTLAYVLVSWLNATGRI
jgi:hypothetical protein